MHTQLVSIHQLAIHTISRSVCSTVFHDRCVLSLSNSLYLCDRRFVCCHFNFFCSTSKPLYLHINIVLTQRQMSPAGNLAIKTEHSRITTSNVHRAHTCKQPLQCVFGESVPFDLNRFQCLVEKYSLKKTKFVRKFAEWHALVSDSKRDSICDSQIGEIYFQLESFKARVSLVSICF